MCVPTFVADFQNAGAILLFFHLLSLDKVSNIINPEITNYDFNGNEQAKCDINSECIFAQCIE